jgi:hypothetical protein
MLTDDGDGSPTRQNERVLSCNGITMVHTNYIVLKIRNNGEYASICMLNKVDDEYINNGLSLH